MQNLVVVALVGSSLVGCVKNKDMELESAESALESHASVESEGNMMMAMMDGAEVAGIAPATPEQIAMRIAGNVAPRWQPAGCTTVEQQGNTITVTYTDCTGPRGLLHVSGQLVLTVTVNLDGTIAVHGASNDLHANEVVLTINADALYSASGTTRTLTVETEGSAVGPQGNELEHVGNYTIERDTATQCGSLVGTWSTEATRSDGETRSRSTTSDVMRCAGGCPLGTVTRTFATGTTLTITFDGTSTAQWETSTGRSGSHALRCQ